MIGQDPRNAIGQNTGLQKDVFSSVRNPLPASVHSAPFSTSSDYLKGREIYIPLQFWFCRNEGLALPLVALQYHEVKMNIEFRPVHELVLLNAGDQIDKGLPKVENWIKTSTGHKQNIQQSADLDVSLWIDYVFLDTDERRRFAQVSHEYLIEQLQFSGDQPINTSGSSINTPIQTFDLFFEHPVKELVWVIKSFNDTKEHCNYTDTQLPLTPPFTDIGLSTDDDGESNVIGLTGLPTGYIDAGTFAMTLELTETRDRESGNFLVYQSNLSDATWSCAFSGITFTGTIPDLKAGDIILLYDSDNDESIHITINTVTSSIITATLDQILKTNSVLQTFVLESIFRPMSNVTNVISNNTNIVVQPTSSMTAVSTWDHLNRLTNYDMVRPVNSYGLANNPVKTGQLRLNGRDRFETRPGQYFNWVQCYEHHTNIPKSPGINVYSFSINPEEHQPSGTCNFSRLDSAQLILSLGQLYYGTTGIGGIKDGTAQPMNVSNLQIYAVNYNILRIMSGMGGIAYHG